MSKFVDISGQTINRIYIDSRAPNKNGKAMFNCVCYCGNKFIAYGISLRNGTTQSCGCLQKERTSKARFKDISGQTINGIYVASRSEIKTGGRVYMNCICHCGNLFVASAKNLKSGNTKSCGCTRYDKVRAKGNDLTGQKFNDLIVDGFHGRSGRKRFWDCTCLLCGHPCVVYGSYLTSGKTTSCGCRTSKSEANISQFLESHHIKYDKQKTFIGCENKKKLRFDFFLPDYGMVIEYDGEFHYKQLSGLDNDISYQQNNDAIKTRYCEENDIILLRIPYWEKDNIESILNDWLFLYDAEDANSSSVAL